MTTFTRLLRSAFAVMVVVFMVFPILVILVASFNPADFISFPPQRFSLRWYEALANDLNWTAAAFNSILAGLVATIVTVAIGLPVSVALVRGTFRGQRLLYGLVMSPMIVPHIITAIGMYYTLTPVNLTGSTLIIGLGHVVLSLPIFVVITSSTLGGFDIRLEDAAVSLGASRLRAVRTVTLPIVAPGIIAASLFAFLTSFDEVIIALLLSDPSSRTLPVSIWNSMLYETNPIVTVVSTYIFVVTIVGYGFAYILGRAAPQRTVTTR